MRKIKKGDYVLVTTGNYKGQKGKVLRVLQKKGRLWVIVEGVNKVKKHIKKGLLGKDAPGGIIEIEAPIDISNVKVICPVCGEPTRVGIGEKDGKKSRVCKKCGAFIDLERKTEVENKDKSDSKSKQVKQKKNADKPKDN